MKSIAGLVIVFFAFSTFAHAEEGHHTVGAQAGNVGLAGDIGNAYQNAIGAGLFFDYAASDWIEMEVGWLNSHHSGSGTVNGATLGLNQNAYWLAAVYDFDQFDVFTPYLKAGPEYVSHTIDYYVPGTGVSPQNSAAFGLDFGAGCRVDFTKNLMAGLDFYYHGIFDASVTPPGTATAVKAVQSYFTVLVRFGFTFGGAKAPSYKN